MNRLRALSLLALVATAVDLWTTRLMVGTAQAAELNPVAGSIISGLGWVGSAVLALGAVALAARVCRWAARRGHGHVAVTGLGAVALVSSTVASVNVALLLTGPPDSVLWRPVVAYGLVLAGLVTVLAWRDRLAALARRGHTERRVAILSLMLILGMAWPAPVGPVDKTPVNATQAAPTEYNQDFESFSLSTTAPGNWDNGEVVSDSIKGSRSLKVTDSISDADNRNVAFDADDLDASGVMKFDIKSRITFTNTSKNDRFVIELKSDRFEIREAGTINTNTVFTNSNNENKFWRFEITRNGSESALFIEEVGNPSNNYRVSISDSNTIGTFDSVTVRAQNQATATLDQITVNQGAFGVSGTVSKSGGAAVKNATVRAVDSTTGTQVDSATTDSSGNYQLNVDAGDYDITAGKAGLKNVTKTVSVSGTVTGLDFTLKEGISIESLSPRNGVYSPTSNVTLQAQVSDTGGDTLTVEFYARTNAGGDFTLRGADTVAGSGTATAEIQANPGIQNWFAEVSAGGNTVTSETVSFRNPHLLQVYNGSSLADGSLIQNSLNISLQSSSVGETRTTSTGELRLDGVPRERLRATINDTTGDYLDREIIIEDPSEFQTAVLRPAPNSGLPGANKTLNATFELVDNTGSFPPSETTLFISRRFEGTSQLVAAEGFGVSNEITTPLEDGARYSLLVANEQGQTRSLGDLEFSDTLSQPIKLTINSIDDGDGGDDEGGSGNRPPILRVNVTDGDNDGLVTDGERVRISLLNSTDPDGQITLYLIRKGGGFSNETTSPTFEFNATLAQQKNNRSVNVVTAVTDDDDAGTREVFQYTVFKTDKAARDNNSGLPTARFSIEPDNPAGGEPFELNASNSTTPAGNISAYEWAINSRSVTNTGEVLNISRPPGRYRILLRVVDESNNSDVAAKTVVVGNPDRGGGGGVGDAPGSFSYDAIYQDREPNDNLAEVVFFFEPAPTTDVQDLTLRIFEQGNQSNEIFNGELRGESITHRQPLTGDDINTTWVVEWSAEINGEQKTGRVVVGQNQQPTDLGIGQFWQQAFAVVSILALAFLFGGINAQKGALVTAAYGGVLWFLGWLPATTGAGAVVAAIAVGALYNLSTQREVTAQ